MEPLVDLLLELGARAKSSERRNVALEGVIADQSAKITELEKKVEELTPKPAPEAPKEG